MGGADFTDLITIGGFLASLYFAGFIFEKMRLSPILGEIFAGVVLGPEVLKLLKSEHEEFIKLLGTFGVTLMIFESGMHINFDTLKKVAGRSFGIAILGTFLPIFAGIGFVAVAFSGSDDNGTVANETELEPINLFNGSWLYPSALHFEVQSSDSGPECNSEGSGSGCPDDLTTDLYPDGMSLGCALAPTSVGIALKLLTEAKQLDSIFGQTIITAAFVDDIFSIVALVILINLAAGDFTVAIVVVPLVLSFTFLLVGGGMAYKLWPIMMEKLLSFFSDNSDSSLVPQHRMHLAIMFGVLCLYSYLSSLLGSHLLGAFVAGMSFAKVPRSHGIWTRQMKRIAKWLVRLFFGSTVAFSIPISTMLTLEAFYKGLLCGIGPCILTKVISGLAAQPTHKMVVGTAMVGRGEFAYLVAETAKSTLYKSGEPPYGRMMSADVYSVCVWALLLSTITAPFSFQYFLALLSRTRAQEKADSGRDCVFGFYLKVKGRRNRNADSEVLNAVRELKLKLYNVGVETDGEVFVLTATCMTQHRRSEDDLDDAAFRSVKHHIFETLNDENAQVIIVPHTNDRQAQLGGISFTGANDQPVAVETVEPEQFAGFITQGQMAHWERGDKTPLVIKFKEPTTLKSYMLKTAHDFVDNSIEPVSWCLEGLAVGGSPLEKGKAGWEKLHETDHYETPTDRDHEYGPFVIAEEQLNVQYEAVRFTPMVLEEEDEGDHAAPPGNELAFLHGQAFRPGVRLSTENTDAFDEFVVIKCTNASDLTFLCNVYTLLQDLKLEISKAKMYHVESVTSEAPICVSIYYCRDLLEANRTHHGVRLNAIRHSVRDLYEECGVQGKSMVRSVKCIDVPVMYGCTPHVHAGERVGEFLFVYKHVADIPENQQHILTHVFLHMAEELGFEVSAFCHDAEEKTGLDHATIFVKDKNTEQTVDQAEIVAKFLEMFKEEGIPARISGYLHEVGPTEPIRFDHWPVKKSKMMGSGRFGPSPVLGPDEMNEPTSPLAKQPVYKKGPSVKSYDESGIIRNAYPRQHSSSEAQPAAPEGNGNGADEPRKWQKVTAASVKSYDEQGLIRMHYPRNQSNKSLDEAGNEKGNAPF